MTQLKSKFSLAALCFMAFMGLAACGGDSAPSAENTASAKPTTPVVNAASDAENKTVVKASAKATTKATGDLTEIEARGRVLYKRCITCHTLDVDGPHKVGPNLHAIFGATAGQKDGFKYSKVMAESGVVWAPEALDAYIENPRKFMPKNRMAFAGLRKPEDRAAVLAYMAKASAESQIPINPAFSSTIFLPASV